MKAAVLREVNPPLQVEEVQIDSPGPHEVVLRTGATGVCLAGRSSQSRFYVILSGAKNLIGRADIRLGTG